MANNTDYGTDTAVTVFADDSIKELLKSGKIEDAQKLVQEGHATLPANASCLSWSKGQIVGKYEIIRKSVKAAWALFILPGTRSLTLYGR